MLDMVDNILAIENQQVIRNYVIDVEMGAYLHKLKQIKLKTAKITPSGNNEMEFERTETED